MRKVKRRTDSEILRILQEYCLSDISGKELQRKYFLSSGSQLVYWFRKFVDPNIQKAIDLKGRKIDTKTFHAGKETPEQEQELERLRAELAHERLRTEALEIMIEIAEKELGVDIRKKPGAKR